MNLVTLITTIFILFFTHLPNNYVNSSLSCPSRVRCAYSRPPGIRFPFRLMGSKQPATCGYPGFNVSCDLGSKQTVLDLQGVGNLSIKYINYAAQELWVNDPDNCLPKKLLNFNLSNTPFSGIYHQNFDFLNCSTMINNSIYMGSPINCLSGASYFVYATLSKGTVLPPPTCVVIASMVMVPVQWPASLRDYATFSTSLELNKDLRLSWFMPECQPCELNGRMCGVMTTSNDPPQPQDIVCSNVPTCKGTTKALIIFGVMSVFSLLYVVGFLCYVIYVCWGDRLIRWPILRRRPTRLAESSREESNVELPRQSSCEESNVELPRQSTRLGLRFESDPKFQPSIILSEMKETDISSTSEGEKDVCTICMVEYQVMDTIGHLPRCGHYFHANCANKWMLHLAGTTPRDCPICRARVC